MMTRYLVFLIIIISISSNLWARMIKVTSSSSDGIITEYMITENGGKRKFRVEFNSHKILVEAIKTNPNINTIDYIQSYFRVKKIKGDYAIQPPQKMKSGYREIGKVGENGYSLLKIDGNKQTLIIGEQTTIRQTKKINKNNKNLILEIIEHKIYTKEKKKKRFYWKYIDSSYDNRFIKMEAKAGYFSPNSKIEQAILQAFKDLDLDISFTYNNIVKIFNKSSFINIKAVIVLDGNIFTLKTDENKKILIEEK